MAGASGGWGDPEPFKGFGGGRSYRAVTGKTTGGGASGSWEPAGQVLGASTGGGGGTGGGSLRQQMESGAIPWDDNLLNPPGQGPSEAELARQRYEAEQRAAIESGYSAYEAELDAMLNEGLPGQQAGLEAQATAELEKGLADILGQRTEGEAELKTTRRKTKESQAKNLKTIAADLRNAFMAGNVFLGARGAGDSSAARMYSYALTKLGSKQRGDIMRQTSEIMSDIDDRAFKLQNIYSTEKNKLRAEHDDRIGQISQWFYDQQNALRGARGEMAVRKGQDLASLSQNLLNQALAEINFIREQAANRQSMLDQWALNNANTIQQVRANLAGVSGYRPVQPQARPIASAPQFAGGNITTRAVYPGTGYNREEERPLFGSGSVQYRA